VEAEVAPQQQVQQGQVDLAVEEMETHQQVNSEGVAVDIAPSQQEHQMGGQQL
jgi:hypothetical protein